MRLQIKRSGLVCFAAACCFNLVICSFVSMAKNKEEAGMKASSINKQIQDLPPIKDVYKDKFLIGTTYNTFNLYGVDKEMLLHHFNAVTPENMMKPSEMQKAQNVFTFENADTMVGFCQENGLQVSGHTLAWHNQTPEWMEAPCSREEAIKRLRNHINHVAGHYNGELLSWDVVNEAFRDGVKLPADGNWKACLRDTPWLRNIGDDYIELAFGFAREADPHAKLYYNDYNLNDANKSDIVAAMFADLRKKGVPIDGIGMQSHYNTNLSIGSVEQSIKKFRQLGAEISITELDVVVKSAAPTGLTKEEEMIQAQVYAQLFKLYKKNADAIARVTFWDYDDANSWRRENFPCLFNAEYSAKEAYYAVIDPEGYLVKNPVKALPQASVISALHGTPAIDGTVDEVWANTEEAPVNLMTMAWQGATGTVKALWDENNIYVLVHVKDRVLNTDSINAHEQDSVEVFLDENNGKTEYYEDDDGQFRVSCRNKVSFGKNGERAGFQSSTALTGDGYLVEMKIPVATALSRDKKLGFDVQINDSNEKGERISIAKFNDDTDNSWQSTLRWGILQLK